MDANIRQRVAELDISDLTQEIDASLGGWLDVDIEPTLSSFDFDDLELALDFRPSRDTATPARHERIARSAHPSRRLPDPLNRA